MGWKVAHACVRGSSHVRSGAPNQDAALCSVAPGADTGIALVAVSDGHGGARHFRSQIGSTLAVSTAVAMLQDFLPAYAGKGGAALLDAASVQALQHNLVEGWTASVTSDLANHALSEEELHALEVSDGVDSRLSVEQYPLLAYGATLLVAAATDSLLLYLQLGDGEILSVEDTGETKRPLPADERLIGNQTTSLCQPDAWKEFRTAWVTAPELPSVVLLSTDGYANSFRSDEDFLKIGKDYLGILREQGISTLSEELPQILAEATQQGSGDDITLAILQGHLWKGAGEEAAPVKPKISAASRSALIEQLKARHSSQHRRIDELATRLEATRKTNRKLQVMVLLLFLAAAGGAAYFYRAQLFNHTATHYDPGIKPPGKASGDKQPGSPDVPGKLAEPGMAAQLLTGPWQLKLSADNSFTVPKPMKIARGRIIPGGGDDAYAEIAVQREKNGRRFPVMINRGTDDWKVRPTAGKKKPFSVKPDGQFELTKDPVEIEFGQAVKGTLSLAPEPPAAATDPTPELPTSKTLVTD